MKAVLGVASGDEDSDGSEDSDWDDEQYVKPTFHEIMFLVLW